MPGFTLVEMLVVLAIIVVISAIVFSGQAAFNRTLALSNAAYDIALSARQAQAYGLSSQAFNAINNPPYGLYFQSATPTSYIFFADTSPAVVTNSKPNVRPGNGYYDVSTEAVQTYTLNNGFSVSAFCAPEHQHDHHGEKRFGMDWLNYHECLREAYVLKW